MSTYKRYPLLFTKGEGIYLYDDEGRQYLDAISGIAVCGLGHANSQVAHAICQQAQTLLHTSNLYEIPLQSQLAERLTAMAGMEKAFFANSGAEANEAAIKIARFYGHSKNIDVPNIVVMEGAFHGRTLATLTATGNRKVQAGFEPLVSGFVRAPYNDIEALETIAQTNKNIVAVMLEPIQGEGGIRIPDKEYLHSVQKICHENQWLLMLDEIQTGNGRTGNYFYYQAQGIKPDVVTTAKGLGNGMPIGVCMASGKASDVFQPGGHGSTFGGNPLACAAALAVIDCIDDKLLAHVKKLGEYLLSGLQKKLQPIAQVTDIRGVGLMMAIELDKPCGELVEIAQQQGVLINVTADNVIRLLPPLILTLEQADAIIDGIENAIQQFINQSD